MLGDWTIHFEKFVDIDELHIELKFRKGKLAKAIDYTYDLNEFTEPKINSQRVGCGKE